MKRKYRWKQLLLSFYFIIGTFFITPALGREIQGNVFTVDVLPTENSSSFEVWESRFYPVDILDQKITQYCISQLKRSPFIEVREQQKRGRTLPPGDMALQLEIYSFTVKDKDFFGKDQRGKVRIRLRVYDNSGKELPFCADIVAEDQRYIPVPGDDRLFFLSARGFSPFDPMYKDGLDLFRLAPRENTNNFSKPVWDDFSQSPYWEACKKAINKALQQVTDGFSGLYRTANIVGYAKNADEEGTHFIISAGRYEGIREKDILTVVRKVSFKGIGPHAAESAFPKEVGTVRVIQAVDHNAIVVVMKQEEDKEPDIELSDIILIPFYHSRM
ncbi:hypothetical protein [Aminobacterium mobile]|uniref:hypothetical protein n=1 Tax=Aminobacterium mobile TaxID=81467 RepID=UPI000466001A|nr:hypothetical protein [Aminobacterium mobile]